MDWQQLVSFGIVAATAALLLRSRLRRGRGGLQQGHACLCPAAEARRPTQSSIVFHASKGSRPEVRVKFK